MATNVAGVVLLELLRTCDGCFEVCVVHTLWPPACSAMPQPDLECSIAHKILRAFVSTF